MLKRMDDHSSFMGRMIERLGVDIDRLAISGSGHDLNTATRRCMACGTVEECQLYLDDPNAKGTPHFCPNAALFETNLKADKTA
jgi:hypothetical protein